MFHRSRRQVDCFMLDSSWDENEINGFLEILYQYTPVLSVGGSFTLFAEWMGSQRMSNILDEVYLRLRRFTDARELQWSVRSHHTTCGAYALALSQSPAGSSVESLPLRLAPVAAFPFGEDTDRSRRLGLAARQLESLGVHTFGDFFKLSSDAVHSRWGDEVAKMKAVFLTGDERPWVRWAPVQQTEIFRELDWTPIQGASDSIEPLLFVFRGLLDEVLSPIRNKGQTVSRIRVIIKAQEVRVLSLEKHQPESQSSVWLTLLRDRLMHALSQEPLQGVVREVGLQIRGVLDHRGMQRDLLCKAEEQHEDFNDWRDRISSRLGQSIEAVFQAQSVHRTLPEHAWMRVNPDGTEIGERSAATQSDSAYRGSRPSRVLGVPEPVWWRERGRVLCSLNQKWTVLRRVLQEVLGEEWWSAPPSFNPNLVERKYYRIETEAGVQLWTFALGSEWFLHGYFD